MYGVYQSTSPATTGAYKYWLTTTKVLKVLEGASWVDFAISKLDTGDIVTVWDSGLKDEFKYYWNGNTWYSQVNGGLVAGSKAFTDLDTSLSSLGTTVSGHTGQLSTVDSRIVNGVAAVDSKWQCNSNLLISGVAYNSGFGLSNSSGTGVGSEFWIDASKLKFTNSAKTGSKAPFTIDASTATPEITFNGKVSFSNVNNVPTINKTYVQISQPTTGMNLGDTWIDTDDNNSLYSYNGTTWNKTQSGNKTFLQAAAPTAGMIAGDIWVDSDNNYKQYRYSGSAWVEYLYNPATAINAGTTTINGPKITTGSITAAQINVTDLFSKNITYTGVITGGNVAGGGLIKSYNGKMKIDLVNGSIYIA